MTARGWSGRIFLALAALAAGLVIAWLLPLHSRAPGSLAQSTNAAEASVEPSLKLTDEQIKTAAIDVTAAEPATLARRILVPGTIVPDANRIARVAVRLYGTVAELRKRPGDKVEKGEVLAVLESRELADAKSDYLAARLTNDLQQDLFRREKAMWDGRLSSEMQFLRSRNEAARAQVTADTTRQKLFALGVTAEEIAALPSQPEASMPRQEIRAPIAGRVAERRVDIGAAVGRDSLETELFVIVDLDRVWVELAISPADLPLVKAGEPVEIAIRSSAEKASGTVIFISPLLDKDSRSARATAEIANESGIWWPGSFVTTAITVEQKAVALAVPSAAILTIDGGKAVFVRTPEGFIKRDVVTGAGDDRLTEIVSGLAAGDRVASSNTFLLKSELLKGPAED